MNPTVKKTGRKKSNPNTHYIDNAEFNKAVVEYYNKAKLAEQEGKPSPRVPEYIGKCFLLLAENISTQGNFRNYTFIADMISDGIDNCLYAVTKFDPTKSSNPFGYFSVVMNRAFIRRIGKEKQVLYRKFKSQINALNYHQTYTVGIDGETIDVTQADMDYINEYIKEYEAKVEEGKLKKKLQSEAASLDDDLEEEMGDE